MVHWWKQWVSCSGFFLLIYLFILYIFSWEYEIHSFFFSFSEMYILPVILHHKHHKICDNKEEKNAKITGLPIKKCVLVGLSTVSIMLCKYCSIENVYSRGYLDNVVRVPVNTITHKI